MTTDNIVMWVIQLKIVDWVDFKTQTLLESLKIQNQLQEESSVSLEVEHSFPEVGCARSKRQCLTVAQNRRLLHWMLVWEWMESLPLICGDVVTEVSHSSNNKKSSTQEASGNRSGFKRAAGNCLHMSNAKLRKGRWNVEQWPRTQLLLHVKRSCTFLKTTRQWSRWSSKDEVQWPTESR